MMTLTWKKKGWDQMTKRPNDKIYKSTIMSFFIDETTKSISHTHKILDNNAYVG